MTCQVSRENSVPKETLQQIEETEVSQENSQPDQIDKEGAGLACAASNGDSTNGEDAKEGDAVSEEQFWVHEFGLLAFEFVLEWR